MTQRVRRTVAALLSLGLAATGLSLAGTASVAVDAPELEQHVAYSRVADPVLLDTPSWSTYSYGYEAYGNTITLAEGTGRTLSAIDFVLANWSCEEGVSGSATKPCITTDPEATFDLDVTVTFYAWDTSGESPVVGDAIATRTETVTLPYRESQDTERCEKGAYFNEELGACRNDEKHVVTFDGFEGVVLPDDLIVGVGIDNSEPGPHRAVNVGLDEIATPALVGSDEYSVGFKAPAAHLWADYNKLQLTIHTTAPFADVPVDHPFVEQIQWMVAEGLTSGYADGSFQPHVSISRQAMAAFLARWLADGELAACTEAPFTDVPVDHPFCDEIQWMKSEDLSAGYDDGSFRPAATVSRQAGAAFLGRAVGVDRPECTEAPFSDIAAGHPFCMDILWMKDSGITIGYADGTFGPNKPMSRQAMAAWIFAASHLPV